MSHNDIAYNREDGGALICHLRMERIEKSPVPQVSREVAWEELDEWDKETDRYLWEHLTAPYIKEYDALFQRLLMLERDYTHLCNYLESLEE